MPKKCHINLIRSIDISKYYIITRDDFINEFILNFFSLENINF